MQSFTIQTNGKPKQIAGDMTIGELADEFQLNRKTVLVELNGEALLQGEWQERSLKEGDRVEFIKMVAGG